ncbi:MAG TPA: hypothetical protein VGO55_11720 [Allosphingosinicella sp.]|jgi:hypothetical protein|nr:hypothetical protein [Allosphingosinicella sp.]
MSWQDVALIAAGIVGSGTALVHGVLVQRLMVRPIEPLLAGDGTISAPIRKLVPPLLQFSTFAWLVGGLGLIAAPFLLGREARIATGLLVGSLYLFGALANCWGTRGRHPGWMLMAAALVLIGFGLL